MAPLTAALGWKARHAGLWLLAACALLLLAPRAACAEATAKEYQVKAAFLFNFARFAEWPATAFADDTAPIRIGILGDDPFGAALDDTVRDEVVRGRKLEVRRARQAKDLADCQLVFVSRSEQERQAEILAALGQRPVLTVSDIEHFAGHGGVIGFYLEGNKVRFEIDPANAQRQQVKLSAQLLRLGRIVGPVPDGGRK
jgi:hypothetical protein